MTQSSLLIVPALIALPVLSQAAKPLTNSPALISAQGHGFAFEYSPIHFLPACLSKQEPRLTMEENGTDMPFDIGPSRVRFSLSSKTPGYIKEKKRWTEREAFLQIVPLQDSSVPDFKKAYPDLSDCVVGLRALLKSGKVGTVVNKDLPDWNSGDCIQTIHAKALITETPWCVGIQYLTTHVQEACEIDNDRLVFRFVGLSRDGKHLINLSIPVAHPSLPIMAPGIDSAPQPQVDRYCNEAEQQLNRLGESSFFPSISSLTAMVQSIRPKP